MTESSSEAVLPSLRTGFVLILLLLPGLLLVDIANGALGGGQPLPGLPVTPGEAVRGLLFVLALAVLYRRRGVLYDTLRRAFTALLVLVLLGPAYGFLVSGSVSHLFFDLRDTVRTLYGPAVIVIFIEIFRRFDVRLSDLFDAVAVFAALAGSALILFKLAGIGQATYGTYASEAHKGLFIAQNDLGLALVMVLLPTTSGLLRGRGPLYLVATILAMAGMLVLGTRTATLGALAMPLLALLFRLPNWLEWRRLPVLLVVGLALLVVVGGTGVIAFRSIASQRYQSGKYQSLLSGNLTRVALVGAALEYVGRRNVAADVIGEGAARYQAGVARTLGIARDRRMSEVDWLDLLGGHGALFMLALYGFYIRYFLLRARKIDLPGERELRWICYGVLGIYLLHGTLAGHALANPIPTGVAALVAAFVWARTTAESGIGVPDIAHGF